MRTSFSRVAWLSFCALAIGCASQRAATQVTVLVDAQPHVRGRATQLVVRVTGGHEGETFLEAGAPVMRALPITWPFDITVTPAAGDATRLFMVEATAYDSGHQLVSQARLRGGYVRGDARHVTLVLEDACIGISCPEESACRNGQCVPIGQPPGDAGVSDAGVGDGGTPHCTVDHDCDDDNICNGFERCVQGACVVGSTVDCDDHVGCTTDTCDGRQCVHTTHDAACTHDPGGRCDATNDCQYPTCTASNCASTGCQSATCSTANLCVRTFACATGQTCCGASCVPAGCDDDRTCTTDYCGTGGTCQHDIHTGPCDDHDLCTGDGTCAMDGTCTAGMRMSCDDANGCTTDACDPAVGCTNAPNAMTCDDSNPCTVGDSCGGGACLAGVMNTCDDGVFCTVDSCARARGCSHLPNDALCGTGARCDATSGCQSTSTCTTSNCQPTPNTCETAACSTDGTTCIRGTSCSASQMCCGHLCVPSLCNDNDVCTDDACDAASSACTHLAGAPGRNCDDGNGCTGPDTCMGIHCTGAPRDCDDFQECTDDTCNPATGQCVHTNAIAECTPTGGCNEGGTCFNGHCFARPCSGGQLCCFDACMTRADCLGM